MFPGMNKNVPFPSEIDNVLLFFFIKITKLRRGHVSMNASCTPWSTKSTSTV